MCLAVTARRDAGRCSRARCSRGQVSPCRPLRDVLPLAHGRAMARPRKMYKNLLEMLDAVTPTSGGRELAVGRRPQCKIMVTATAICHTQLILPQSRVLTRRPAAGSHPRRRPRPRPCRHQPRRKADKVGCPRAPVARARAAHDPRLPVEACVDVKAQKKRPNANACCTNAQHLARPPHSGHTTAVQPNAQLKMPPTTPRPQPRPLYRHCAKTKSRCPLQCG